MAVLPFLRCQGIRKWATRTFGWYVPLQNSEPDVMQSLLAFFSKQGLAFLYREKSCLTPSSVTTYASLGLLLLWWGPPWLPRDYQGWLLCCEEAGVHEISLGAAVTQVVPLRLPHMHLRQQCVASTAWAPLENGQQLLSLGTGGRSAIEWWHMAPGPSRGGRWSRFCWCWSRGRDLSWGGTWWFCPFWRVGVIWQLYLATTGFSRAWL